MAAPLALTAGSAHAQAMAQSDLSVKATTDYRERGLSWSNSDPALRADATIALSYDVTIEASAATLRGSARHGGSDWGFTVAPRYSTSVAGWDLSAGVAGHLFAGADKRTGTLDYVELESRAAKTLGPAQLALDVSYAPSQAAIGGSNVHLGADLGVGVPGTPFTAFVGGGYSFGDASGDPRSTRLRPDGDYADWYAGLERSRGPLSMGVIYTDTSIGGNRETGNRYLDGGTGARISGYLRFFL